MKKTLLFTLCFCFLTPLLSMTHREQADSLVNQAARYYREYRFMDALDVLAKAVEVSDATKNEKAYVRALLSIGNIHSIFNDYEQALHYYSQCYDISKEHGMDAMCSSAGSNMLLCYCMMGKAEEAQECYSRIKDLKMDDINLKRFYNYLNQGLLARVKKDLHAAIYFHNEALEYAKNHEMGGHYVAAQMGQLGTLEEELNNDEKALEWYHQCEEFSKEGGFMSPLVTSYEKLANLYRKEHNDSASMRYQRLYVQLSDSLFSEREFNSKRGQIVAYETQHNILEISSLNDKNRTLLIIIAIIMLMLLILGALIIYITRQNRKLVATQRLLIDKHNELNRQLEMQNRLSEEFFNKEEDTAEDTNDSTCDNIENNTPLLSKRQADLLLLAIAKIMEDTDCISDPDFSLQTLANKVKSNTKYVSWVINATYGKNFKTYLNEYRIREAARRLADIEKYGNPTMAVLAEQLGYKSPTSFNQAFKRILGMTPAAYQKLVK